MPRKVFAESVKVRKALIIKYKQQNNTCLDCNHKYKPIQMDFHHRDPATKRNTVTLLVNDAYSMETIWEEIAKCDLICANCHRLRHEKNNLFNFFDFVEGEDD